MRLLTLGFVNSILSVASAHFHLQYPPPRGPFVAADGVTFCDGYADATTNRTEFPLNSGFVSITGSHPHFTFGVILSTAQNPNNFANFSQAVDFFSWEGEGAFCLPVNFSGTSIKGISDGANVTIQTIYDAGNGRLYQCSDLTLRENVTISSEISCTNGTVTSTSPSGASNSTQGANNMVVSMAGLISIVGAVWAAL